MTKSTKELCEEIRTDREKKRLAANAATKSTLKTGKKARVEYLNENRLFNPDKYLLWI